jgi:hypothetical protein
MGGESFAIMSTNTGAGATEAWSRGLPPLQQADTGESGGTAELCGLLEVIKGVMFNYNSRKYRAVALIEIMKPDIVPDSVHAELGIPQQVPDVTGCVEVGWRRNMPAYRNGAGRAGKGWCREPTKCRREARENDLRVHYS